MPSFEFVQPDSLAEVLALLDRDDPEVRLMGGGTALMLMMKAQLFRPRRLVCLQRAGASFSGISEGGDVLRIGGMATFSQVEKSAVVARHVPSVRTAMATLANVRVRNVATIGGNLAHADPHLDLPPLWAALGARATLVSQAGSREIAVEDIPIGYNETNIANDEVITQLDVPLRAQWRSSYVKVTTRAAHDWPALGLAMAFRAEHDRIVEARIFLGAALDKVTRLAAAEQELCAGAPADKTARHAAEAAVAEVDIESDSRGSRRYKEQLLRTFFVRTVEAMMVRAAP